MRSQESADELRATLIGHAQRIVARDGADALTMRLLAGEAGCALGLPYKVFANRDELVAELVAREFRQLGTEFAQLIAGAGTGTVGTNLARYADLLLDAPGIILAHQIGHDPALRAAIQGIAEEMGVVPEVETVVVDYLAAEQRLGRIDPAVDVRAMGFLVAGAIHNLLAAGPQYPRPSRRQLRQMLDALADRLTPPTPQEEADVTHH